MFPIQGLNLGLLHCRQTLYWLSHEGSPLIRGWINIIGQATHENLDALFKASGVKSFFSFQWTFQLNRAKDTNILALGSESGE